MLKVDSEGNIVWQKSYLIGIGADEFYAREYTNDGGFIAAGTTNSFGSHDVLVAKLDSYGSIEWLKRIGGNDIDLGYSAIQTLDNNFIIVGSTDTFGFDNSDGWIMKLGPTGNIIWQRTYGGGDSEHFSHVFETNEGDLFVFGGTNSYGEGGYDSWFMKSTGSGEISGCHLLNDSFASIYDVSADVITTTFGVQSSDIFPANTFASPLEISMKTSMVCSYPKCKIYLPITKNEY